ncbi:MAG: hypothetical protein ABN502_16950 [Gammaproteobacteria bacterium]
MTDENAGASRRSSFQAVTSGLLSRCLHTAGLAGWREGVFTPARERTQDVHKRIATLCAPGGGMPSAMSHRGGQTHGR